MHLGLFQISHEPPQVCNQQSVLARLELDKG